MKHIIDDEMIEYVGILAKLELSDTEKEQAKQDIEQMLDYIDRLGELDTEDVEPLSHVLEMNPFSGLVPCPHSGEGSGQWSCLAS